MNIVFLGGGDEIGASSAIVELGSARILIDCGIRMSGEYRLPDLAAITQTHTEQLDAALLTHAHMDHSGALPVLHQHFPGVPIYANAPTRGLVEVLLRDSVNIMRVKGESEQELPLYSPSAVDSLIEGMITVPFGTPVDIGRTGVTATWFPAGHILGAASIGIEGVEQGRSMRVLFSGDIAVADQLTVPGMMPPAGFRPDVLVIEATYGDRLHSPRKLEEQRLIEMATGIIERRGKLLIPAFAIGRAQEVILMLLKEFRAGRLARFPVWIDGMVKTVCSIYSQFPAHQTPYARRLIEKHGNPFFNIVDEIKPVTAPPEREKVLTGDPCVIIASSGMLTGGASAFYAQHIATDERNGIAITGYQDEESPGRQLLSLAEAETRSMAISGRTLEVKSGVTKYALSAHADSNEIVGLIEAINPREVVLVHGEGQSREALRDLLKRQGIRYRPVHLPRTGDRMTFGAVRRVIQKQSTIDCSDSPPTIGGGQPLDEDGLKFIAKRLRERGEEGKLFTETELLDLWYGFHEWDEEHYGQLIRLLDESGDFCRPKARPHRYRLLRPEEQSEALNEIVFATPQEVLSRAEDLLGPETGLYHKGYDIATHTLKLAFCFPDVAGERYREQCEAVVRETGWTYVINDKPHQGRLAEVAIECLPPGVQLMRAPAIHLGSKDVVVKLGQALNEKSIEAASAAFHERTGFELRLHMPLEKWPSDVDQQLETGNAGAIVESRSPRSIEESKWEFLPSIGSTTLDVKRATVMLVSAFDLAPETWRPSRLKLKTDENGNYIELAFLTPELGRRQKITLQEMATTTGFRLRIRPNVNTYDLVEIAKKIVPPGWLIMKQPSLHSDRGVVQVKVAAPPSTAELVEIQKKYDEVTGFGLEVIT
ncbi:MAG: MBL fold metallo-hydrolase [Chloracidobacterium sp.]|nr:MBL fold metallo-hydrolase [Chloracidobacterium sp.]